MHKRILIRLDRLNVVTTPEQMNLPGFFEFDSGDALRVDFEQYH